MSREESTKNVNTIYTTTGLNVDNGEKYRIEKVVHFGEMGYKVQQRFKFLWMTLWIDVTHTVGWGWSEIFFCKTKEAAEGFIKELIEVELWTKTKE